GAAEVLSAVQQSPADVIGFWLTSGGPHDGVSKAGEIRRFNRQIPLILVVSDGSEARAIAAIRAGVTDYLPQPLSLDELSASVMRCLAHPCPGNEAVSTNGHARVPDLWPASRIVGESQAIRKLKTCLGKIAVTDSTVLITGESGTGKELVSELIHKHSPRALKPMVCINCAALPEGLLESELFGFERGAFTGAHAAYQGKLRLADGGTVLFDEIGDMSLAAQAKVLRTIESKEIFRLGGKAGIAIDVRIIAATNQELERRVEDGRFRKDLYFRLNVARIHLPPLRDRKEDIPLLVEQYVRELNRRFGREIEGMDGDALESFLMYDWPGNIRELKYLLEAVYINLAPFSKTIAVTDLPEPFQGRSAGHGEPSAVERDRMLAVLCATQWNKSKAAEQLHWSRMTLYRKMHKYQIPFLATQVSQAPVTASRRSIL
ncbi:MAG: sigma-54-dependent Fis family transcriptional regulator, partial [Nitrospira sp.]